MGSVERTFEDRIRDLLGADRMFPVDIDVLVEDELAVSLCDLNGNPPYLWATIFRTYDNGLFESQAGEASGGLELTDASGTLTIFAGQAPEAARTCTVSVAGTRKSRRIVGGFYFVAVEKIAPYTAHSVSFT